MNITVKAPPGGRYEVDVQKVKERYKQWRRLIFIGIFLWIVVGILWLYFTQPDTKAASVWGSFVLVGKWYLFTLYGWVSLAYLAVGYFGFGYLADKKMHFECPFRECSTQIYINEPWDCPQCRDDKITFPTLFRTFFDKCRHGHRPESYQCPTCVKEGRSGIFELIPNGRTDKPAKKANLISAQVVQLPSPPPPPVQGQVMPRDRNFF